MKKLHLHGSWNRIKSKLINRHNKVKNNDLDYVRGQEEQLLGNLQKRTGKSKDALIDELNNI